MKKNLGSEIHKKMTCEDKFYGTTTVGTKGQVVIPAEARKDLNLKPGDQLMVMGKFNKTLGLIKADQMEEFVKIIMNNFSGTGMEKHIKVHIEKLMGGVKKNK